MSRLIRTLFPARPSTKTRTPATQPKTLRKRLLLQALEDRCTPASFLVINTNDAGAGSLRDAITMANTTAGNDTINFDTVGVFSTPQTITLLSTINIIPTTTTDALTIAGTGKLNLIIS